MTSKRFTFIQTTPIYNRAQDQFMCYKKTSTIDVSTAVLFEDVVPRVSEEAGLIFRMFEINHIQLCKDLSQLLHEELQGHSPQIQPWLRFMENHIITAKWGDSGILVFKGH
ncbi:hypothetical protein YC2023_048665 [Brassica napus]